MAEMLLINPRKRRRASAKRKSSPRRSRARRRNPIAGRSVAMRLSGLARRRSRRHNPIARLRIGRRRRRNPISMGGINTGRMMAMFKDAAIGGAGAIAMDIIMGQVNGFLPASFQTSKSSIGIGDAVKAGLTAFLGQGAARMTKGLSIKMAQGALAVQAYEILSSLVPASFTLGYASPAAIVNGSPRVGPTRSGMMQNAFGAYAKPGRTPLLSAYATPGRSPLLNGMGARTVQQREGVSTYR